MKKFLVISNLIFITAVIFLFIKGNFWNASNNFIDKKLNIKDTYTYDMNIFYKTESEKFMLFDKQADIVMLGNSITAQIDWNELLRRDDIANRGLSGDITEGMLKRMKSVLKVKPKICFFMGGINDITRRVSIEKTVKNIKQITEFLTANDIKPVIQSVLYTESRFYSSDYNNPIVTQLNDELKKFCEEKNIIFLDLNKYLSVNETLKSELTDDGLHLNAKGYAAWGSILVEFLSKKDEE